MDGKTQIIVDKPKTKKSNRVIPLPNQLVKLLKIIKKESNSKYVITTRNSGIVGNRSYQRTFKFILKKVNVPYRRYVDDNDFVIEFDEIPTLSKIFVYCKGKDIEINAERIINEDIEGIISDLNISTELKEKVDKIIFSDKSIKDKRFAIRRMRSLPSVFRKMFLKLLEYIAEV